MEHRLIFEAGLAVILLQAGAYLAVWLLGRREVWLRRYLDVFVGLAVGVLLGTVFLHLLPEMIDLLGNGERVWMVVAGTVLALLCVGRVVSGLTEQPVVPESGGSLQRVSGARGVLAASMLHSFVDGAAVATAFAASARVGWLTAFAVALHEVPHRVGDFSVFVHFEVPAGRARRWAAAIGVPALAGVLAVVWVGFSHASRVAWLLPVSAGSFLYIATVNLIPELEGARKAAGVARQIVSLLTGVLLVIAAGRVGSS